jgi:hypothetical protein
LFHRTWGTRRLGLLLAVCGLIGCTTLARDSFNERYGQPDPKRFDVAVRPASAELSYHAEIQPILERRCVVCHGCYDASCQIKLGAWDGVARGGSSASVYDSARLNEAPMTRLFIDAQLPSQWRDKGFYAVLNERRATPEVNLAGSLLYQSLALKQQHPLPNQPVLGDGFDFSLDRDASCPRIEEFDAYAKKQPLAGMPYGLPGLNATEHAKLARWLAAGSPYEGDVPLSAVQQDQLRQWEAFLNGPTLKERLMSRYLFEHLFLGHLMFDADPKHRSFRIVRSTTPSGQPVQIIPSRRPYDDPGAGAFYYRLVPEREALLAKTHMPYALNPARMEKYRRWFLAPQPVVTALPSYDVAVASNPFIAFRDIAPDSRYRFLLDEAQFFIMNFIKGPVCRGQVAVDVIRDNFWVFFVDPQAGAEELKTDAVLRQAASMQLPAEAGSDSRIIGPWLKYAQQEREYLQAKSRLIDQSMGMGRNKIDLSLIWDGGGNGAAKNSNAGLTIFRHFDSASVVKGLVGEPPKTAWVIGYALFERIYYLLVAGYDVYGDVGHQLNTRLYMDFMRMEGEFNFLLLLPRDKRRPTAEFWYRDAVDEATDYVYGPDNQISTQSAIDYRSNDPQRELYGLLQQRLKPVLNTGFDLSNVADPALRSALTSLATVRGANLAWLPEMSVLRVDSAASSTAAPRYFTLVRNTAHSNVTHLLREKKALLPAENSLTVVPGFIGAYPNAFYKLVVADLPAFEKALRSLASEQDYRALADRFAVRRTSTQFWATSDALHDAYQAAVPLEAGLFDYNRFENR